MSVMMYIVGSSALGSSFIYLLPCSKELSTEHPQMCFVLCLLLIMLTMTDNAISSAGFKYRLPSAGTRQLPTHTTCQSFTAGTTNCFSLISAPCPAGDLKLEEDIARKHVFQTLKGNYHLVTRS